MLELFHTAPTAGRVLRQLLRGSETRTPVQPLRAVRHARVLLDRHRHPVLSVHRPPIQTPRSGQLREQDGARRRYLRRARTLHEQCPLDAQEPGHAGPLSAGAARDSRAAERQTVQS
uniref:Uncharacterized protein n=1 Tax=Cacopsylla melanoneura TaxID=428564 RepID=A0A8D8TBH6_9HEMI